MDIRKILIEKYGYSKEDAVVMENDLSSLDSRVAPIFEAWKASGEEKSSVQFHGYSINSLRTDYSMNFFAALVTLDWIAKEPENALNALRQGIM